VEPNKDGVGIKPYTINEMTMMAYYKKIYPERFFMFPVVPNYDYYFNRHTVNMSHYSPGGKEVGPDTGSGIWDPSSWGQYLGGTYAAGKGRTHRKGFKDATHIAGSAMRLNTNCTPVIICSNKTLPIRKSADPSTPLNKYSPKPANTSRMAIEKIDPQSKRRKTLYPGRDKLNFNNDTVVNNRTTASFTKDIQNTSIGRIFRDNTSLLRQPIVNNATTFLSVDKKDLKSSDIQSNDNNEMKCYTAPYVRCSDSDPYTPLWNLHVHSKNTQDFKSLPCPCPST